MFLHLVWPLPMAPNCEGVRCLQLGYVRPDATHSEIEGCEMLPSSAGADLVVEENR